MSAESAAPPYVSTELPALYGRSEDVAAVRDLIRHHALVTVVGPAGIGKTRLARAVAHELRGEFADGVRTVEFAPLADPDIVAATVARALGIAVGDPRTALELTVQALAGQCLLLVLDNCEHLLDAVDLVVAALRKGSPTVRVLATSQELLRHPDEHVYRLGPLALPAEVTATLARKAGAVQLFVARVQAVDPRFQLSDGNVGAAVDICRLQKRTPPNVRRAVNERELSRHHPFDFRPAHTVAQKSARVDEGWVAGSVRRPPAA